MNKEESLKEENKREMKIGKERKHKKEEEKPKLESKNYTEN